MTFFSGIVLWCLFFLVELGSDVNCTDPDQRHIKIPKLNRHVNTYFQVYI